MATNHDPLTTYYGRKATGISSYDDRPAERYDWSIDHGTPEALSLQQENADLIISASENLYVSRSYGC